MKRQTRTANKTSGGTDKARLEELKRSETAMKILIARQEAVLSAIPDIIMEVNNDKIYTWANQAGFNFFGEDVIGKEAAFYFEGEQSTYQTVQPVFAGLNDVVYVESWQRRRDGQKRLLAWRCRSLKDEFGRVKGAMSAAIDITEQRRAEELVRESEDKFKYIFDYSNVGKSITLPSGEIRVNKAFSEMIGFSPEEIQSKKWQDFTHPDDIELTQTKVGSLLSNEKIATRFTKRFLKKDGSVVWVDLSSSLRRDEAGKPLYMMTAMIDITERKRAEEALRESEREFRSLAEAMPQIVWITRPDGWNIYFNQQWVDYTGLTLEESYGQGWIKPFHPDDQQRAWEAWQNATKKGAVYSLECRLRRADGNYFWWLIRGVPRRDAAGNVLKWFGTCTDIHALKQVEEALRESEQKYHDLYEFLPIPVYEMDFEANIVSANRAIYETFGGKEEVLKKGFKAWRLLSPEDIEKSKANIQKLLRGEQLVGTEYNLMKLDGSVFPAIVISSVIYQNSKPVRVRSAIVDITERKRAEAALQTSEARYRQLVENAEESILVAQDGLIKFVNRKAVETIGYSERELISRPFLEFIHPDDREKVADSHQKRLAGETVQSRYVFRLLTNGGVVRWTEIGAVVIDWEGRPATLNFLIDVTERHKAEEMIQASLREKELMLREIHHRVKNNMQVISSLFNLQAGHTQSREYREILKAGQTRIRSMSLVHEKLYQSRDLSKIDLATYIQSLAVNLFQAYLIDPNQIRMETDFGEVFLDINSAVPCGLILNELISNSLKHAFPEGRKGTIRIGVKRTPDDAIILWVADDGIGFPKNFDFRQTESLGLQIANLLVGQLEGTIELDRENGTAFLVTFREMKYPPRI